MKIYKLEPTKEIFDLDVNPWVPQYDKCFGMVVIAENEFNARKIASSNCGDEGKSVWLDCNSTSCKELTNDGEGRLILSDFVNG